MEILQIAIISTVLVGLYLLPSFVAAGRKCKAGAGVAVVNIFLGWTLLGWVVALAWAVTGDPKPAPVPAS